MQRLKCLVFLLPAVIFSSCFFIGPSHIRRLRIAEVDGPLDVAIVPGLPFKDGHWDTLLKARILWSLYLYKHGIVKNIIYSGNAVYTPYTEGKSMALYAYALGLESSHIFIDTLAEHSTENLYYSYQLAKKLGFKKLAVATDPFQCYMLYKFSKKHFNTRFYFLPVIYDSIAAYDYLDPVVDTKPAYIKDFVPLDQRMKYSERFKGTMGKGIKYD
jgi:hypothetical protein